MNAQGKIMSNSPAIAMGAQVPNKYVSILRNINIESNFTVNCTWGEWSAWESCSVTCGGGNQVRNRSITQQALFAGNDCTGDYDEQQTCNSNGCPGMVEMNH